MNIRQRLSIILETDHGYDKTSRIVDYIIISLIILNVIDIILESVLSLSRSHQLFFRAFEFFSVLVFSIEYLARLWSCPDIPNGKYSDDWKGRLRYMISPMAVIDLLAIAPFYLSLFISIDLRFLRVIRLMRIFKLTRYSPAFRVLLSVLQKEAPALSAAFYVLLILLTIASSGIYLIEHKVQPEAFGSIPAAMWWAMATLTTVGYGDVVPITAWGKFFGGCITIIGMGMVALPAAILASGFSDELRSRREQYQVYLKEALRDGVINESERKALERIRLQLGITLDDANLLQNLIQLRHQKCPHCHKPLDGFNNIEADDNRE